MARTKQYHRPSTGRVRRLAVLGAVLGVSLAVVLGVVIYQRTRPYEPPPFEPQAVTGEPSPPAEAGYGTGGASVEGSFQIGLASKWVRSEDGSLPVWFCNPAENDAYLMLLIRQESDKKLIYESGLLRPGEYVESLSPLLPLPEDPIAAQLSVYSFNPENYNSLGTFHFDGTIE